MTQGGPLAAPHIDHCIVVAHCVGAGFYPAQSTYVYRAGGAEPLPYARLMYSTALIGSRIIKGRTGGQSCRPLRARTRSLCDTMRRGVGTPPYAPPADRIV